MLLDTTQTLTERELFIYRLIEDKRYTTRELGDLFGLSHVAIQNIHKRAKSKIVDNTTKKD